MVKNAGGNKSKKMGRKFLTTSQNKDVRMSTCDDEVYAVVTKALGNGMCSVMNAENVEMLCIIRNKFRGRGKRDNMINVGTLVLVGIREWEALKQGSKSKCDLLEVYSDAEKVKLKKSGNPIFGKLIVDSVSIKSEGVNDGFEFLDDHESNLVNELEQQQEDQNNSNIIEFADGEVIDTDDI